MKDMFVCYGILERFIVDNMFFNSVKFKDFVNKWEFEVVIFSLYYLKFNGFVERNVQIVKQLLRKVDEFKQDVFFVLLEFCNFFISGMDEFLVELFMSRKFRIRLLIFKSFL